MIHCIELFSICLRLRLNGRKLLLNHFDQLFVANLTYLELLSSDVTLPALNLPLRMSHLLAKSIGLAIVIGRLSVVIFHSGGVLQGDRLTGSCRDVM